MSHGPKPGVRYEPGRPHPPCEWCGLTDDVVDFARPGRCKVCDSNEIRGKGPRNPALARVKSDPLRNYCPSCDGFKGVQARLCSGCARRPADSVCACGAPKVPEAETCRACWRERQRGLHVCREEGPHSEKFDRRDLCHRHYQVLAYRGELPPMGPRLGEPDDARAEAADPYLAGMLAQRRRRLAAQQAQAPRQRPRSGPVGTRRAAA